MGNGALGVRGKTCYIAGPMRGIDDLNRDSFNAMERRLSEMGAKTVYNPIRLAAFAFDGKRGLSREDIMRQDVSDLMACDMVVMLEGWEHSRGASLEHELAVQLGIRVVYE